MRMAEAKRFRVSLHGKAFDLAALHSGGKGPALFFLHALGGCKEQFLDAFSHPGLAGRELLAVDLPGFGDSPLPPDFSCSLEAYAELLSGFFLQHRLADVVLVGHSMGGAIGLLLAERLGLACKGFISLEGNLTPNDPVSSRQAARFSQDDFLHGGFEILVEGFRHAHGRAAQFLVQALARCSPLAYHRASLSLVAWSDSGDLLWKLEQLPCSKAYFYGDHTRSLEAVQDLEGEIECIRIPGAGHFLMLDNPVECYAKLAEAMSMDSK